MSEIIFLPTPKPKTTRRTPTKLKNTRKKLIRELDKIVSLIVRKRDGRCVVCGKVEGLTNGHLFSRSNYSTRWDFENCYGQCLGCNMRHEFDPYPYTRWFIGKFGLEKYDELYKKHRTVKKWKDWELQDLLDGLKLDYLWATRLNLTNAL